MRSRDTSTSLNMPSSLLVKVAPHSVADRSGHRPKGSAGARAAPGHRATALLPTLFQLREHRTLRIDRRALGQQQPPRQISLVERFKHVFACAGKLR